MPMRRIALLCAAVAGVLAADPPGSQAVTTPSLSVASVGAPPRALSRGDAFTVQGRVTNRGRRARTALLSFTLRATPRSRNAIAVGAARVRVRAGSTGRYRARLRLDPFVGQARSYVLVACVRARRGAKPVCRAARRRTVVGGPVATGRPPARVPAEQPPGSAPTQTAQPQPQAGPAFTPGARSLGDRLFPQIGNGGYDALRYRLALDWTPATKRLDGVATITIVATQPLSELSFDLAGWNVVESVTVAGTPAAHRHEQTKLVVTPAQGLPSGTTVDVVVTYGGTQRAVVDPDGSLEGWIPTSDGAFVVNEPIGAQGWFPSNNHPTDKALFDFEITVPEDIEVIANGREVKPSTVAAGRRTWYWREDAPMATYLTTATNGQFGVESPTLTDPPIPVWNAIDSSYTVPERAPAELNLGQVEPMLQWLAGKWGPYPFTSSGGIVDRGTGAGYALESQTKPNYPSTTVTEDTYLHEHAHQWYGNSVSPATWSDLWLNEGPAEFSAQWWQEEERGLVAQGPAAQFDAKYASEGDDFWDVPPAAPPTAADLFDTDAMYERGAMVIQALREIMTEPVWLDMMRTWEEEHRYASGSTQDFIALVKRKGDPAKAARYDEFFAQWLYGTTKPAITPETF